MALGTTIGHRRLGLAEKLAQLHWPIVVLLLLVGLFGYVLL
jgi:hypothetical protein